MSEQDQATSEGGIDINADNIAAIREELSGGFSTARKESQLPPQQDTTPPANDQPQGEEHHHHRHEGSDLRQLQFHWG